MGNMWFGMTWRHGKTALRAAWLFNLPYLSLFACIHEAANRRGDGMAKRIVASEKDSSRLGVRGVNSLRCCWYRLLYSVLGMHLHAFAGCMLPRRRVRTFSRREAGKGVWRNA